MQEKIVVIKSVWMKAEREEENFGMAGFRGDHHDVVIYVGQRGHAWMGVCVCVSWSDFSCESESDVLFGLDM